MPNTAVLRSGFEGTEWRRAFAGHLLKLLPDMNPDAADEASDLEYLSAKGLHPKFAAKRWIERREKGERSTNLQA